MNEKTRYQVIKCAMEVHSVLGNGFLESVYQNAFFSELHSSGFHVEKEKPIEVYYKGLKVGNYYADLFVNDELIIEIKCVTKIVYPHIAQLKNYLNATRTSLGFIFNFKLSSLDFIKIFP